MTPFPIKNDKYPDFVDEAERSFCARMSGRSTILANHQVINPANNMFDLEMV
jgi:hypothetical protein